MNRTPVEDAFAGALRAVDAPTAAPDLFLSVQAGARRQARRRRGAVAVAALAVAGVAFVPSALGGGGGGSRTASARVADAVQVLQAGSSAAASSVRYWSTLRDVLPNVTYAYDGAGGPWRDQVTDSAIVGRVIRTEPARGMLAEPLKAGEDVRTRVVAFDDPQAAWRVLSVTVDVSETLAGARVDELVLDWALMGSSERGQDARAVGQALKDLGTLVVLSKASPDGPEFVPGRWTLQSGYGIGRIAADGTLAFPLVAEHEGPSVEVFQDNIDTLAELRVEARKPPRTKNVVPEQGR